MFGMCWILKCIKMKTKQNSWTLQEASLCPSFPSPERAPQPCQQVSLSEECGYAGKAYLLPGLSAQPATKRLSNKTTQGVSRSQSERQGESTGQPRWGRDSLRWAPLPPVFLFLSISRAEIPAETWFTKQNSFSEHLGYLVCVPQK